MMCILLVFLLAGLVVLCSLILPTQMKWIRQPLWWQAKWQGAQYLVWQCLFLPASINALIEWLFPPILGSMLFMVLSNISLGGFLFIFKRLILVGVGVPQILERFFPYLGLIGNQATGDFYLNKSPYAQTLFVYSDNYYPRALTSEDEPKGKIKDDDNLSPFLLSYLVCLRPGILTFKFGSLFLSEPYAPNRYARQFGFGQACPKVVDVSCRAALSSDPPLFYYQWCEMMRRRTNAVIELPSPQFRARVTEPYARWWIASSFVILQFSPDLKRKQKQPNPQSKTPKKKTKKPTILDSPYSPPRYNTLPSGCSSNKSTNSSPLMSLPTRPCPDTTTKPSPTPSHSPSLLFLGLSPSKSATSPSAMVTSKGMQKSLLRRKKFKIWPCINS